MLEAKTVKIVHSDARGRVSLGRYVDHDMFMLDIADDGVITLTPMVAMPQKVSERIDALLDAPATGVRVSRPGQRYAEITYRAA